MAREVETRRRILRLIRSYPGLHLRELAREAGLSEQLVSYHVDHLEDQELVESRVDEVYRRFYATEVPAPQGDDRRVVEVLRQAVPLQIVLHLLERAPLPSSVLVKELGLAKSTVSYHVKRLTETGIVERRPDGLHVSEPERVSDLLVRWQPPRSLTDRFMRLWSGFYRRRR